MAIDLQLASNRRMVGELIRQISRKSTSMQQKTEAARKLNESLDISGFPNAFKTRDIAEKILEEALRSAHSARARELVQQHNYKAGDKVVYNQRVGVIRTIHPETQRLVLDFEDGQHPKTLNTLTANNVEPLTQLTPYTIHLSSELVELLALKAERDSVAGLVTPEYVIYNGLVLDLVDEKDKQGRSGEQQKQV